MTTEETKITLEKFRAKPALFFENILGVETLEEYQRRVIQTVADNERTAIAACHDVGKSFLMARIVTWFASCFPYSKVITTAPTYNQVKNILWSEIRAAHARSRVPLGGKLNLTDWQIDSEWFALGFTPKNEVSSGDGQGTQSSFQGFHAPYLLVVFDEATGIPHNIWTMAEGLMTSHNVKFVAIGNPTSRNAEFFKCFSSPEWAKIYLSCFDSPNLIANGLTDMKSLMSEVQRVRSMNPVAAQEYMKSYKAPRPYLLSAKWVVGRVIKWGEKHPLTVSKVFGKFPDEGDNVLMPLGAIEAAMQRTHTFLPSERKTVGVDVARFGTDSSVLTSLHGLQWKARKSLFHRDTAQLTGEVIDFVRVYGANVIVVDETGLGGGVLDMLREAQRNGNLPHDIEIRGVQFGGAVPCDSDSPSCDHKKDCSKSRYLNLKAYIFGLLADDIKDALALGEDDVYLDELPTILYSYDSKGKAVIESKDDYKRRTGRKSPDDSDSLALANYGRYNESPIGTFTSSYTDFPAPFAASLGAIKRW